MYEVVGMIELDGRILIHGADEIIPDKGNPELTTWESGSCERLGFASTVGEAKKYLDSFDDEDGFGFRNQPQQAFHKLISDGQSYAVFQ